MWRKTLLNEVQLKLFQKGQIYFVNNKGVHVGQVLFIKLSASCSYVPFSKNLISKEHIKWLVFLLFEQLLLVNQYVWWQQTLIFCLNISK